MLLPPILLTAVTSQASPSVDAPLRAGMESPLDAAVVVGLEDYAFVPDVPMAHRDASAFRDWLVFTRGVPANQVQLLTEGNREQIVDALATAAGQVQADGILWFYFAGHGAVSTTTGSPLLLGDDARGEGSVFDRRGVTLTEIAKAAGSGRQARLVAVVDACNAGLGRDGAELIPGMRWAIPVAEPPSPARTTLWMGAWGNQFARPYDAAQHGLFTYAVIGALRGWADGETTGKPDGTVDIAEASAWVERAVRLASEQQQVPHLENAPGEPLVLVRGNLEGRVDATILAAPTSLVRTTPVAVAETLAVGEADANGIAWAHVPGGTFQMGSTAGDADERPIHGVVVDDFLMSRTEVTFSQFQRCVDAGACTSPHLSDGSCFVWGGSQWVKGDLPEGFRAGDHPVVCVDHAQALAFARWAGGRLPTEAEWEYAARSGGRKDTFPWGDDAADCLRAVLDDGGAGCGQSATWPACSHPQGNTVQGLCDMAGNASEWVADWYGSYGGNGLTNPSGPAKGTLRVVKGGSWFSFPRLVRATVRVGFAPTDRCADVGFRIVRDVDRR